MSASAFALLGHPVGHSVSPAMFAAAFESLGLPHRYERIDVPDEAALARQLARLRAGELAGANVTMPHKRAALQLADRAHESAAETGAANVLTRAGGGVVAHNTDVAALLARLPACGSAVVLGAGGAALAAVRALRQRGCAAIALTSRSLIGAGLRDARAGALRAAGAELIAYGESLPAAEVVVQATSAGVRGGAAQSGELLALVPWHRLDPRAFAIDLVYGPEPTPFVRAARERGLRAEDGLAMLVGQAELAFRLWLGEASPAGVMEQAARGALAAG